MQVVAVHEIRAKGKIVKPGTSFSLESMVDDPKEREKLLRRGAVRAYGSEAKPIRKGTAVTMPADAGAGKQEAEGIVDNVTQAKAATAKAERKAEETDKAADAKARREERAAAKKAAKAAEESLV